MRAHKNSKLIIIFCLVLVQCKERKPTFQEYILDNYVEIDLKEQSLNFNNLFENDITSKEVFFSSEEHGVAKNKALEIRFLKYFINTAKVKYLLIEHGYAQSMRLNSYLDSGDESILRADVQSLKGTLSYTKQFFSYWKKVYQLNKSLDRKDKIQVVGIDLGWRITAIRYLKLQFSEVNLDNLPQLKDLITSQKDSLSQKQWKIKYESVLAEIKNSNINQLSEEQLFEVSHIIKNLIRSIDAFSSGYGLDTHRKRDQYMYENFLELYARLPKGKYFGQWGLNHVYQSPQLDVNWLGHLLNYDERSPVKDEILSIATFYNNSERIKWRSEETELLDTFNPNIDTLGIPITANSTFLFRLNEPNSPFMNKLLWYGSNQPDSGVTTDYFQYMLIGNELKASDIYK